MKALTVKDQEAWSPPVLKIQNARTYPDQPNTVYETKYYKTEEDGQWRAMQKIEVRVLTYNATDIAFVSV